MYRGEPPTEPPKDISKQSQSIRLIGITVVVLALIAVITIILPAISGGQQAAQVMVPSISAPEPPSASTSESDLTPDPDPEEEEPSAEPEIIATVIPTAHIGEDVRVGDVRWKVVEVQDKGQSLTTQGQGVAALQTSGKFIWLRFQVEYVGPEQTIGFRNAGDVRLIDNQGRRIKLLDSVDVLRWLAATSQDSLCLAQDVLYPHKPITCDVVFDTPSDVRGLSLRVSNLTRSPKEAYIDLGL